MGPQEAPAALLTQAAPHVLHLWLSAGHQDEVEMGYPRATQILDANLAAALFLKAFVSLVCILTYRHAAFLRIDRPFTPA